MVGKLRIALLGVRRKSDAAVDGDRRVRALSLREGDTMRASGSNGNMVEFDVDTADGVGIVLPSLLSGGGVMLLYPDRRVMLSV
jgi:hypothetical protein